MTFKHGDKVTCKIEGVKITDAKISIDSDGQPFICQNEKSGADDAEDTLGYKYSWSLNKDFTEEYVTNLKKVNRTMEDLEVGDVVVDEDGDESKVLERFTQSVLLSSYYDHEQTGNTYTIKELIKDGYTLKGAKEEEVEELTMEDVCKELGRTIKIKK